MQHLLDLILNDYLLLTLTFTPTTLPFQETRSYQDKNISSFFTTSTNDPVIAQSGSTLHSNALFRDRIRVIPVHMFPYFIFKCFFLRHHKLYAWTITFVPDSSLKLNRTKTLTWHLIFFFKSLTFAISPVIGGMTLKEKKREGVVTTDAWRPQVSGIPCSWWIWVGWGRMAVFSSHVWPV